MKTQIARPVCRVCFTDIKRNSLITFFKKDPYICPKCFKKMDYDFQRGKLDGYPLYSLAKYKGTMSDLLIRYKESLDYELYPVFLSYYADLIHFLFSDYKLVLVPSSKEKTDKRGFDQLKEIFKITNLPVLDVLSKDSGKEQKKRNASERKESASLFHIHDGEEITNKKILLCDDVITTGTSLKTCLNLIERYNPKRLKIMVLLRDTDLSNYS